MLEWFRSEIHGLSLAIGPGMPNHAARRVPVARRFAWLKETERLEGNHQPFDYSSRSMLEGAREKVVPLMNHAFYDVSVYSTQRAFLGKKVGRKQAMICYNDPSMSSNITPTCCRAKRPIICGNVFALERYPDSPHFPSGW
jgi:hypothetical protein